MTKILVYRLWTYDVWGNARDGFEVNDRYKQGIYKIRVRGTVHNQGTPHEFTSFHPTDIQLARALGLRGAEWEGESNHTLYATSKRNSRPICELEYLGEESELEVKQVAGVP